MSHIELGRFGEKIIECYLKRKHYRFCGKNYRFQKSEIDLIFEDLRTNEIVFVEVKTRKSHLVDPLQSVGKKKQKLIIQAADNFCKQNAISLDARFDLFVLFIKNNLYLSIKHIENAFSAYSLDNKF